MAAVGGGGLQGYLVRRILLALPVLVGVSLLVFGVMRLAPGDPAIHLALGTAYQRSGRKADAAREFALQKTAAAAINENVKTLRKTVSGVPTAR